MVNKNKFLTDLHKNVFLDECASSIHPKAVVNTIAYSKQS